MEAPTGVAPGGRPAHVDQLTYLKPDGTSAIYADRDTGHRFVVDFWLAAELRPTIRDAWSAGGITNLLCLKALSQAEVEATLEAYVLPAADLNRLPLLHAPLYDRPCIACDETEYRTDSLFRRSRPEARHA